MSELEQAIEKIDAIAEALRFGRAPELNVADGVFDLAEKVEDGIKATSGELSRIAGELKALREQRTAEAKAAGKRRSGRKVVQIATANDGDHNDPGNVIVALCDDGTVWKKFWTKEWEPVGPVPQGTFPKEAR